MTPEGRIPEVDIVEWVSPTPAEAMRTLEELLRVAHDAVVEEQGDGSWDAVCRCGWESTGHEDRDAADSATDEHRHSPGD